MWRIQLIGNFWVRDSAFDIINLSYIFEDNTHFSENTSNFIGGIVGGVAFIIIIGIIIFVICKRKNNEVKGEKSIVHQNDLYGNISNQEEHEERYDTKIVDTNQYYDDYDNAELK